jgi:hypothetical protein
MNLKGFLRSGRGLILKHYSGICPEELRKNKNLRIAGFRVET